MTSEALEPGEGSPDAGLLRIEETADFERRVLAADLPVLVSFTATWCAPCVWIYPYLREFAVREEGRLRVFAIDVDRLPELAERYRIASVPITLLIEGGVERARSVGVEPERLRAIVAEAVGAPTAPVEPGR